MPPGDPVKNEPAYKEQDPAHRDYWEKGSNENLSPEQKDKLEEHADKASKYDRETKSSRDDVPRKEGTTDVDHGALMRNVKQYTADTLNPHGDDPPVAPPRPLGDMLDQAGSPTAPNGPFSIGDGEYNWVCINLAEFAAGLLRKLGYPVRETNVYLSVDGEYTYQSAAIQVWFEGKWHWVDPFTCKYDPAVAWTDFSDMYAAYWNGTEPVPYHDWQVLEGLNWLGSDWKGLADGDVGNDLQPRFYPPNVDTADPGKKVKKALKFSRASAERAGAYFSTPTRGIGLYLQDERGRITDRSLQQIPGTFHVAAGKPILYSNHALPPPRKPGAANEGVFFGTVGYDPAFDEVGAHLLTLYVTGEPGTEVALVGHGLGRPKACVEGVPARLELTSPVVALPIVVTIPPVDAALHAAYERLIASGLADADDYAAATVELLAYRQCCAGDTGPPNPP